MRQIIFRCPLKKKENVNLVNQQFGDEQTLKIVSTRDKMCNNYGIWSIVIISFLIFHKGKISETPYHFKLKIF